MNYRNEKLIVLEKYEIEIIIPYLISGKIIFRFKRISNKYQNFDCWHKNYVFLLLHMNFYISKSWYFMYSRYYYWDNYFHIWKICIQKCMNSRNMIELHQVAQLFSMRFFINKFINKKNNLSYYWIENVYIGRAITPLKY